MERRALLTILLAGTAAPALAQAPRVPDPLAAVRASYSTKQLDDPRRYSKRLRALYDAAMKKSKELDQPVAGLDFSPAVSGQDYDDGFRKSLGYRLLDNSGSRAIVEVTLKQFESEPKVTTLRYSLVLEARAWKIDEITNPAPGDDGWVYSDLLKAGAEGK